jgi:hypothetical protein
MLNAIMLSVVMLSVVKLIVVAPFFTLLLIIEEATEKILKYIMPLKSIYNKNFVFVKKCVNF